VKLRAPLKAGRYQASARGRDSLGNAVTAKPVTFRLR
jgi:hypothetical protein